MVKMGIIWQVIQDAKWAGQEEESDDCWMVKIMQEIERKGISDSPFASPCQDTNQPISTRSIKEMSEKIKGIFTL